MTSKFINLPPPPSDPVTPSEMGPGTPNSTTTSLSALSTTAIKDGHTGAPHHHTSSSRHHRHSNHHHNPSSSSHNRSPSTSSANSTTTLDAERADRISRLAGLERVATVRQTAPANPQNPNQAGGQAGGFGTSGAGAQGGTGGFGGQGGNGSGGGQFPQQQVQGYFDAHGTPHVGKERSTVGSASATGSMGGRTTWASGSVGADTYDDKMSVEGISGEQLMRDDEGEGEGEDPNADEVSSVGGMSDEGNASLVGFGEGANSTVDGPVSRVPPHLLQQVQGQLGRGAGGVGSRPGSGVGVSPPVGGMAGGSVGGAAMGQRERNIDGVTYDRGVVDTVGRSPVPIMGGGLGSGGEGSNQGTPAPRHAGLSGAETSERIVRERFGRAGAGGMGAGDGDVAMTDASEGGEKLGRFEFEK